MSLPSQTPLAITPQVLWNAGYEIVDLLSRGPFADHWQVRDQQSGALAVWKQLRPEWESQPRARALLENEAAVGTAVVSPFIPRFRRAHLDAAPRYVVWDDCGGETLACCLQSGARWTIVRALRLMRQCAQGLADLHTAGFTHGDLRAEHIRLGGGESLHLTELGAAQRIVPLNAPTRSSSLPSASQAIETRQPGPPPAVVAQDLQALGMVGYQLLTGQCLPVEAITSSLLQQQRSQLPLALQRLRPGLSADIVRLLVDLLALHPLQRPTSAQSVVQRIVGLELSELTTAAA